MSPQPRGALSDGIRHPGHRNGYDITLPGGRARPHGPAHLDGAVTGLAGHLADPATVTLYAPGERRPE